MSVEKMNTKIIQPPKEEIVKPQKMGLLVENPVYKPFRYPWCYDAWLTQQRIHWLPEEVPLGLLNIIIIGKFQQNCILDRHNLP